MNRFVFFALSLFAANASHAAAIEQVIVRQQWPWSTDIKVEYKISEVDAEHPVNIGVTAYNGSVELDATRLESSMRGSRYGICESGVGEFFIDPVKAFGTEKVALANFKVKLTLSDSDQNASEVIYKIFDLTAETGTFPCRDVTRADIKNGLYGDFETSYSAVGAGFSTDLPDVLVWTGVTNYPGVKTTKLVMRKIPKGTFSMGQTGGAFGAGGNAAQVHDVTLTKDYFVGVFPVTQMQYKKLTRGVWDGSGAKGDGRPVESALYSVFRSVVTNSISANLLGAVEKVDYPTEAQWECACRAGTTSELYTGKSLTSENLNAIAWHSGNSGSTTHPVGEKLPNAYGLYDMIGNVYEACADYWTASSNVPGYSNGASVTDPCVDTVQPDTPKTEENNTYNRNVIRGGYFSLNNTDCTSAGRNGHQGNWTAYGFRLAFTVND